MPPATFVPQKKFERLISINDLDELTKGSFSVGDFRLFNDKRSNFNMYLRAILH